ncbi:Eco57I restriction-modification methylase domain-containing protein [Streptomonospora litoralis]|uniref:site-specific DNA-methyltransferase (adenine-specific) n=1 Tax=Streptomonospora litoralis TaxID=2498135 RepID=A0A4P6Q338_9ACTN|nr:SAM-dependent DNA methyltransferase [Streptomonospora litoralis]QBI53077.1 hypothetical protein EKD16_06395 [Streptomonospora litoralis]
MSAAARNRVLSAVCTVGGLLPADLLVRLGEGAEMPGSRPGGYGNSGSRAVREEAECCWHRLRSVWRELCADAAADAAVTRWVETLFAELGFGSVPPVGPEGIRADGSGCVPIHITAWRDDLDDRPAGDDTAAPHSLVQVWLNRNSEHLWAVLTNGRRLRLLRAASSASAIGGYVEFDVEAIFGGGLFDDFVLLYRLLHATRFAAADGQGPSSCRLEQWRREAAAERTRALESLRGGVRQAVAVLGTGFLRHPANGRFRRDLDVQAFHGALLRLVFRLLLLFVAEDRGILHPPGTGEQAERRYAAHFSAARLRNLALRGSGDAGQGALHRRLVAVLDGLQRTGGRPDLGLPELGGLFERTTADAPLAGAELSDEVLLAAVRCLAQIEDPVSGRWRTVDYRELGADELGEVYESLLGFVPEYSAADAALELVELAGSVRKTTGAYYTPPSLIETLLDTTLDPVVDEAEQRGRSAAADADGPDAADHAVAELLRLTVCDPACGTGHFLVAAARRIARRVAAVREGTSEPTPEAVRRALPDVVARCVYGVDANPTALELAKAALWLEAPRPGSPRLLDAHLKCGNSLIGATPASLREGIPDAAFEPVEGDDRKHARSLARINAAERGSRDSRPGAERQRPSADTAFAADAAERPDTADYGRAVRAADAWCAAFLCRKTVDAPRPVTDGMLRALQRDPAGPGTPEETRTEIARLRERHRFFHWHPEFPDVFAAPAEAAPADTGTGSAGGFSCVLGNPPWERIKVQAQEFFAQRDPAIAAAPNGAARRRAVAELEHDPDRAGLHAEFAEVKRRSESQSHFLRNSGHYRLTGRGDINTYAVFAETARRLTAPQGRTGLIVPTGIATDATTRHFFADLARNGAISALYDFENRAGLFPAVDSRQKFCVLSLVGSGTREPAAALAFFLRSTAELREPGRVFTLAPAEIALLNPNTGTLPVFRSRRDAEIVLDIYKRVPVLVDERDPAGNPWGAAFHRMFDMSTDSHLFRTREELLADGWRLSGNEFARDAARMLPLYESKMLHLYDHRWAAYRDDGGVRDLGAGEKRDPSVEALPRYWVDADEVANRRKGQSWDREWCLGFRKICRATDERTAIAFVLPEGGLGDSGNLVFPAAGSPAVLYANMASLVFDYVLRQKLGGTNLNFFQFAQLPVLPPADAAAHRHFIEPRVLELVYTSHRAAPFARDLGDTGAPFVWDEDRRRAIRAELDALFLHLYGIGRADAEYILGTFPIVRRKDTARYGTYRTAELVLADYDRMAETGAPLAAPVTDRENFTSTLNPPPGRGPRARPSSRPVGRAAANVVA